MGVYVEERPTHRKIGVNGSPGLGLLFPAFEQFESDQVTRIKEEAHARLDFDASGYEWLKIDPKTCRDRTAALKGPVFAPPTAEFGVERRAKLTIPA